MANAVCCQSNAQVFWDSKGSAHSEFVRTGTNVNSERYFEMLRKLKTRLGRIRPYMEQPLIELDDARQHKRITRRYLSAHLRTPNVYFIMQP